MDVFFQYWPFILPITIFFYLLYNLYTHVYHSKVRGVILTEFDIPKNLTPLEVGIIYDGKFHKKDVLAEIIYLAIQGYIGIKKENNTYIFELYKKQRPKNDFDTELILKIFNIRASDAFLEEGRKVSNDNWVCSKVTKKEIETRSSGVWVILKDLIYESLTEKGSFPQNPLKIKVKYISIGIICFLSIFFLDPIFHNIYLNISLVFINLILLLFAPLLWRLSPDGVKAKKLIQGFREYLLVAEKERIKFHSAPERYSEIFEKFLPYAMVLGIKTDWENEFENIFSS